MIWRIIILMLMTVVATGCGPQTKELPILEQSDISLTWKDNIQVTYSSSGYQMGYNDATYEYRVYDDRLANWFSIRCDSKPETAGQELTADVSWTGRKSTKSFTGRTFKVEKTDENGLIWLWCQSEKIGIIIKNIQ